MRIIEDLKEMTETARGWLASGMVGFVPLKCAIHDGHRALIQEAQKACQFRVVGLLDCFRPSATVEEQAQQERIVEQSLQSLGAYPDLVVFIPRDKGMYASDFTTHVRPSGPLIESLDEDEQEAMISLMTLTIKCFHLVRPDIVYFGQKDAQQVASLRQVIRDLNIDVRVHVLPTVRESDGLALSNRNSQLSALERQAALLLYQALLRGKAVIEQGERRASVIEQAMSDLLRSNPLIMLERAGVYHPVTSLPLAEAVPGTLLSVNVHIGGVRLVDAIHWLQSGQWII